MKIETDNRKEIYQRYYENHKEEILVKRKEYYERNKERMKANQKEYYHTIVKQDAEEVERRREYSRNYYHAHKEYFAKKKRIYTQRNKQNS